MSSRVFAHIRGRLVRGVILLLPLLVTVWLLGLLFNLINSNVAPLVRRLLEWGRIPGTESWLAPVAIPVVSLLLTALATYLLGLVAGNLAGRRLLTLVESWILRIPLVKGIYGSARQLLDAFGASGARAFSKVVLLEYPRAGLWTLGFVTTEVVHMIKHRGEESVPTVPVFLPTTPNPTSGWMILVPTSDLRELDISIEDAIKLIVSGGIVAPNDIGALTREWSDGGPQAND
jgi:uncharacterized membrane protein